MKNIILINLFSSFFIFCQSIPTNKSEYFLLDLSRLDNLDKKISTLIKSEIKKMKSDIKNQFIVNYKIEKSQDRITKREVVGYKFPSKQAEDRYLSALLSMNNPTQYQADYLKQQFQTPIYRTRVVQGENFLTEFKKIPIDKITFTKRPGWSEVVDFYGGYANLASKNINKEDWKSGKFDISAKLNVIEFINDRECLAYVEITGDLNLNGVSKSIYKYKGSYKIEDLNIFNLYKQNLPNVVMTFNDKKYLGATNEIRTPISSFVSEGNILINLKTTIDTMFDDLISDEVFSNIDEIKNIKYDIEKKRIAEEKRKEERRIAEEKRKEERRIAEEKLTLEKKLRGLFDGKGKSLNGEKHGWWSYKNNFGEKTFILWEKDKYVEQWEYEYYQNGQVKEEPSFKDGKKHGDWVRYFPNGDIMGTRTFVAGLKEGLWIEYYKNPPGKRDDFVAWKGKYISDKREGKWEWFWLNRENSRVEKYKNGVMTAQKCYERTGIVIECANE